MLLEKEIYLEHHWIQVYIKIEENQLVDVVTNESTSWQEMKKRNGKLCEIDINHTVLQKPSLFSKCPEKTYLTKLIYEKWEEE